jgi:hypothetical protein
MGLFPGYFDYCSKSYCNPPIPTDLEPIDETPNFITDAWDWPTYSRGGVY